MGPVGRSGDAPWDHYDLEDAYECESDSSLETPTAEQILAGDTARGSKLGEEDWAGHFEEQLLDMYYELKRMNEQGGWPLLERLTYPAFCEFAYAHSSGYKV